MPAPVTGIHVLLLYGGTRTWMGGISPAMTNYYLSAPLFLRPIRVDDFRPGSEPDFVVAGDIIQGLIQIADAMRHAHQEGMERNPHDAAIAGAFFVQNIETLTDAAVKVGN